MTDTLFEPAPDFDQPIAVLKHCHDRIRKQLATLQKLAGHLPQHGADTEARQAAAAILKYFDNAAPNHHEDEEHDLFPMLQATATGEDAALLQSMGPDILREHREMEQIWTALAAELRAIAAGGAAQLSVAATAQFSSLYTDHMAKEEANIAPMAKRLFNPAQMAQLGDAMRARRGIEKQGPA